MAQPGNWYGILETALSSTIIPNVTNSISIMRNSVLIICLLMTQMSLGQTKSQKVKFENYTVSVNNFFSECYSYSRFPSENEIIPIKFDTIFICETPCDESGWYINGQMLRILSKKKAEIYEVYFATEFDITQTFDTRGRRNPSEGWEEWYKKSKNFLYVSSFKSLKKISSSRFKLPSRNEFSNQKYSKMIKQKFNLRDTLIEIPQEVGMTTIGYHQGSKLFTCNPTYCRLMVKRILNGKLQDIKCIVIGLSDGCD